MGLGMEQVAAGSPSEVSAQKDWLGIAVKYWFAITAVSQWLFVIYILGYFGVRVIGSGVAGMDGTHLANGFIAGDGIGNVAVTFHVLFAGLIIAAGQIQLIPKIRRRLPKLHRFSGRFYMLAAALVTVAGIYLMWSRERVIGSFTQDLGTTVGGILTFMVIPIALYYARNGNIAAHRRWALRLFMLVSAVWFLRLMTFSWIIATGGAGLDMETFRGPFLSFVHFAQYLLPLFILELYFKAQRSNTVFRNGVALTIGLATTIMLIGTLGISAFLWIPKIGA